MKDAKFQHVKPLAGARLKTDPRLRDGASVSCRSVGTRKLSTVAPCQDIWESDRQTWDEEFYSDDERPTGSDGKIELAGRR